MDRVPCRRNRGGKPRVVGFDSNSRTQHTRLPFKLKEYIGFLTYVGLRLLLGYFSFGQFSPHFLDARYKKEGAISIHEATQAVERQEAFLPLEE